MRPPILLVILAAALGAAVPAAAQGTGTTDTTPAPPPATTPAPPPAPVAVQGRLAIRLKRVNGASAALLAGERLRVRGTLTPYVAGQHVVVRFSLGGRRLGSRRVAVRRVPGGRHGRFVLGYLARRAGRLTVAASHRATPALATVLARPRAADVLPRRLAPGARGAGVRIVQERLGALGYVVGARGTLDARTARAILAFRKVTGMARTTEASTDMLRRLARGAGRFRVRHPEQGKHVEADLSSQVLALIRGHRVERIYPISSGKPSTPTILGSFRVYSKTPGTNAKGMVFTSYFSGGYGIHGYAEVPPYAASHGCLRVPIPDAVAIYDWIALGDPVDVYR